MAYKSTLFAQTAANVVVAGPASGSPTFPKSRALVVADLPTLPVSQGGTGQTTAAAARGSSGLNIDERTTVSDAAYTILATDRYVGLTSITAARIFTLPSASSVNPGQFLVVQDESGSLTNSITLTVKAPSGNTLNGVSTGTVVLPTPYQSCLLWTDGSSQWFYQGIPWKAPPAIGAQSNPAVNIGTTTVSGVMSSTSTTDSISSSSGAITTSGGIGVAKAICFGSVAESSPANGMIWLDSTSANLQYAIQATPLRIPGVLFTQGVLNNVTATTSPTSIFTGASGTILGTQTIQASTLSKVGRTIHIKATGSYQFASSNTLSLALQIGGTTIAQNISTQTLPGSSGSFYGWDLDLLIPIEVSGSSGAVRGKGNILFIGTATTVAGFQFFTGSQTTSINLNGSLTIDILATWSSNSGTNSFQTVSAIIEII